MSDTVTRKQAADLWYQPLAFSVLHRKVRIVKKLIWWKVRIGLYTVCIVSARQKQPFRVQQKSPI